jgi:hypothetical protein|nr:MAG TPA: hypothetical protein [Crassvirales sp.]
MWISILNYNMGQIEVADMTDFDLDTNNTDANTIAEMWLLSNGYNSDEVKYMLTDECPLCVVNNLETHLNL